MGHRDLEDVYRLTPMQEGMLFHSLGDPELGLYVEQATTVLEGDLEPARLRAAWERVVAHHPALRASFHWRTVERPVQAVRRRVEVPWRQEDWRSEPSAASPEAERSRFDALVEADRRRGFDLGRPPLLRLTLVRVAERRWRFLWSYHHLLLDGWSLLPVLDQVFEVYAASGEGREPALPPARAFVDYVAWLGDRDREADPETGRPRSEAFWRRALDGFEAPTPLPGRRPSDGGRDRVSSGSGRGSGTASGGSAKSRTLTLPRGDSDRLRELARRAEVTVGTLVQAAWALLLGRSAGEDDVVFGTVVSGRPPHLEGASSAVGLFINTVPVRVEIDDDAPLLPWLRRLQERLVELREHEHSPLARVHRWSAVPAGEPLFRSLLAFENYPRDPSLLTRLDGLEVRDLQSLERTNYPLNLAALPGDELLLELAYDPEVFEPGAPERLLGQVATLLRGMASDPEARVGELPLLSPEEERRVLVEWNATEVDHPPPETLHGLVAEQVRRHPERVAVAAIGEGREPWTYAELDAAARGVAGRLRRVLWRAGPEGLPAGGRLGDGPLVGVLLERSAEAYAVLLGVLQAGAAYLPLDPHLPDRRLEQIVDDARPAAVVTRRGPWGRLAKRTEAVPVLLEEPPPPEAADAPPAEAEPDPDPESDPDRAAYVIYTSGSTGRPKGVVVTHRSAVNLVHAAREHLGLGPDTRVAQIASLGFDASVAELFFALAWGGRVVPVDRETLLSPPALAGVLERAGANLVLAIPSLLDALDPEDCPTLGNIVAGADRCPPQVAARWSVGRRFGNDYGPTEATVYCLRHEGPGGPEGPPIGRPIANARSYVLDRRLRPVPPGVPGELCIGGLPLARGYLRRPGRTAESFVPHPFGALDGRSGERLYRTGDLARFLPDGEVEFLGRIDRQVKIRGQRVECGEVEAALRDHPAVVSVAVVALGEAPHRRLTAFAVAAADRPEPDPGDLRAWLSERLPAAMVPSDVELLDALPTTATGKLDRRALERRETRRETRREAGAESDGGGNGRPPAPGLETALARAWEKVLGVDGVGADDDFFRLGGDSILAIRLISAAAEEGIEITPRRLFENPTVARLAAAVAELDEDAAGPEEEEGGAIPLTPVQRRFFDLVPENPHHWNLPVLLRTRERLPADRVADALHLLVRRHQALRTRFERGEDGPRARSWTQRAVPAAEAPPPDLTVTDLAALPPAAARRAAERATALAQGGLDLARAPLRTLLLRIPGEEDRLLLVLHHLVVDVVSWGILLEELERTLAALAAGEPPRLPPATQPFGRWARSLEERARSPEVEAELPLWRAQLGVQLRGQIREREDGPDLPLDGPGGEDVEGLAETVGRTLDAAATAELLDDAPGAYQSRPEELVLTALARSMAGVTGRGGVTVLMEGIGRPDDVDLSRTVGWLTALHPVRLELPEGGGGDLAVAIKAVKERLRNLPRRGLGYGLLRHLRPDLPGTEDLVPEDGSPALAFNYLGRLDLQYAGTGLLTPDPSPLPATRGPRSPRPQPLEVNAYVLGGRLRVDWRFGPARIRRSTVEDLADRQVDELRRIIEHCRAPEAGGFTPSDFPAADLDQDALDRLLSRVSGPDGDR